MATYNSSSISRGDPPRSGVYPVAVVGVISIGNVTLTNNDIIPICKIPPNCFIKSCLIDLPILTSGAQQLTISLLDTLASPTTYISSSSKNSNFTVASNFTMTDFVIATVGTMYGNTARSIGSAGAAVVVWASGVVLQMKVTATAAAATGGTVNIPYIIEFAPNYDQGV